MVIIITLEGPAEAVVAAAVQGCGGEEERMGLHPLTHHFQDPVPNELQPGTELGTRSWGPLS